MRKEYVLELDNPGVTKASTDRRRFSLRIDGQSSSQDRKARRERAAPYPPKTPVPVVDSCDPPGQVNPEAILQDTPNSDRHPIDPPTATPVKTNIHPSHPANRNVMSRSGTIYTLLPYTAPAQDPHRTPVDVEDSSPELPNSNPPSPTPNVGFHQGSRSGGVKPPTLQEGVSAADDDEVIAIAKKILERYKKTGERPETEGEEEDDLPSQDEDGEGEDEEAGPERLYESLEVARDTRPFYSSSGQGETVWWSSSSETLISRPPSKVEPELGDLYIHRNPDENSIQIWLAYEPLQWTELEVDYMEAYQPDRVVKDVKHPAFHDRLLKIWKNGEPSWVTKASCATLRSRYKE